MARTESQESRERRAQAFAARAAAAAAAAEKRKAEFEAQHGYPPYPEATLAAVPVLDQFAVIGLKYMTLMKELGRPLGDDEALLKELEGWPANADEGMKASFFWNKMDVTGAIDDEDEDDDEDVDKDDDKDEDEDEDEDDDEDDKDEKSPKRQRTA